jgi:hypothetical protein
MLGVGGDEGVPRRRGKISPFGFDRSYFLRDAPLAPPLAGLAVPVTFLGLRRAGELDRVADVRFACARSLAAAVLS